MVFLIDASGSMKQNDALGIRKAATQAAISLLSPEDEIAIVEFGSEGRILTAASGDRWLKAGQYRDIFQIIEKVHDNQQFTDFRSGLLEASRAIESSGDSTRKVVVLLTDGILEPNPTDEAYSPHGYSYRLAMANAGLEKRRRINEEYRERLAPMATRMILDEILPRLKVHGAEIFTIALSANADQRFLKALADSTSHTPTELHSFYVEDATDLIGVFTAIIQYFTDKMILYSEEGDIRPGIEQTKYLDEFVSDPQVFTLVDGTGTFELRAENGQIESAELPSHPNLRGYSLIQGTPPSTWTYAFRTGSGRYSTTWVGTNMLRMSVRGLRNQYRFGEVVQAEASLHIGGLVAPDYVLENSSIIAEITPLDSKRHPTRHELARENSVFKLSYQPVFPGLHIVRFTAYARGRKGQEVLPRPGIKYQIEVLPRFYVTPSDINFGKAKEGRSVTRRVNIHCGLENTVTVNGRGELTQSSSGLFRKDGLERFPTIDDLDFSIAPGTTQEISVTLRIPRKAAWGDHAGVLTFAASNGASATVEYRIHVPSIWERLSPIIILLVLAAAGVLAYLVYIWGILGSPSGVLIPLNYPDGTLLNPIKLSQLRRGPLNRWFNWRRNRLTIRSRSANISLPEMPLGMHAELSFYRFGGNYIRNFSSPSSGHIIAVEEEGLSCSQLGPGDSLSLRRDSIITLNGYKLRYEDA